MLTYFPTPYPDEVLYSLLARLYDRLQYPSRRDFVEELFGAGLVRAVVDLPSHLEYLVSVLPLGHSYTVDDFIDEYTLLPFYAPFLPQERLKQLRLDMRGERGHCIHTRAGIMASRVPSPQWLRYCPVCVDEDRKTWGECYWHRVHQVPGVRVCPEHNVALQNSEVGTVNRCSRHFYIAAERVLPASPVNSVSDLHEEYHETLVTLSRYAQWLLTHSHLAPVEGFVRHRYLSLLAEQGWATPGGRVYFSELLSAFESYYSPALLQWLNCALDRESVDNWLARLLHATSSRQHPLYHLLLLNFLGCPIASFFADAQAKIPFGVGPWPCLNPVCQYYREPVIATCDIRYSRYVNWKPIGTFACECGFTYTRTGPARSAQDRFLVGKVAEYGAVWEAALRKMWQDKTSSLRSIGRALGVYPRTVKYHAIRLGLSFEEHRDYVQSLKHAAPSVSADDRKQLLDYRETWCNAIKTHPQAGVKALRGAYPAVYAWLYRHDRDWLQEHTPYVSKSGQSPEPRVDWAARDQSLAVQVRSSFTRLIEKPGKPQQISVTAIGRDMKALALLQKHLDKLPLTAKVLDEVVESRKSYALRRLEWAVNEFRREGTVPVRWQLVKRAGLGRLEAVSEISVALEQALRTFTEWEEQQ